MLNDPKLTNKYTNAKYNPVGKSCEEGFHCLTLVTDWMKNVLNSELEYGDKIVGDITWDNVNALYEENPDDIYDKVEEALSEYMYVIPNNEIMKGDLLGIKIMKRSVPVVYVGMGKILLATPKGVKVMNLKNFEILRAYRVYDKQSNI